MSLDRKDIRRGIDKAAENLKDAVDSVADRTRESRARVTDKAREVAQKAGDEMIQKGRQLKRAADSESEERAERQFPC